MSTWDNSVFANPDSPTSNPLPPVDTSGDASLSQVGNEIGSWTIGILWRASSGTVDPWTKALIIEDAGGINQNSAAVTHEQVAAAQAQADTEVTKQLVAANADPSQFVDGLKKSIEKLSTISISTVIVAAIVGVIVLSVMNKA